MNNAAKNFDILATWLATILHNYFDDPAKFIFRYASN